MKCAFTFGLLAGIPASLLVLFVAGDESHRRVGGAAALLLAAVLALVWSERKAAPESPLRFGAFALAAVSGATLLGVWGVPLWVRGLGIFAAGGIMEWRDRRRSYR